MSKRCIECGKVFSGSVIEHYQKYHMSSVLRNTREKIASHPDIFAPQVGTERSRAISQEFSRKAAEKKVNAITSSSNQVKRDPKYHARFRQISALIDGKCDEQTHRGGTFMCDLCQQQKTSGKRLLSYVQRFTICYSCHRALKQANPQKRGNSHFWIDTPM